MELRESPEEMNKTSRSYREQLLKDLKKPSEAAAYLNAALEDGSQDMFFMALRDVAEARGMVTLAKESELNRENLYRMLSAKGNPQLSSLSAILKNLGLRLSVDVMETAAND